MAKRVKVRGIEIREIELLDLEKNLSREAEKNLDILIKKAKEVLEQIQDLYHVRNSLINNILKPEKDVAGELRKFAEELAAFDSLVKKDREEIVRLADMSARLMEFISESDNQLKYEQLGKSMNPFSIFRIKLANKVRSYDRNERKQTKEKQESLAKIASELQVCGNDLVIAIQSLQKAAYLYSETQKYFRHSFRKISLLSEREREVLSQCLEVTGQNAKVAKAHLTSSIKLLSEAKASLDGFKKYLKICREESEKRFAYEKKAEQAYGRAF
ncbi:hypothetical protein JXB11_02755 [Candidatus Woesearchaeota archaeon]|nr:hypothetical protein [Candidatus Woesearchaeota archaeon]